VLYEEKWLSFAAAKFKGNHIKVFQFQVDNCQIVSHQQIATIEADLQKDTFSSKLCLITLASYETRNIPSGSAQRAKS